MYQPLPLRVRLRQLWLRFAPRTFLRFAQPTPHELGLAGEELAARHLRQAGWTLRARRRQTAAAEVDIWAWHAQHAWVVEVKTRRMREVQLNPADPTNLTWSLRFRPAESFTFAQQKRLAHAAHILARTCQHPPALTLIEVFVSLDGRRFEVIGPSACLL
jgi:Holliday junction resolvase-like predicted endonuclease